MLPPNPRNLSFEDDGARKLRETLCIVRDRSRRAARRGGGNVGEAATIASLKDSLLAAFAHAPALSLVVVVAALVVPLAFAGAIVRFAMQRSAAAHAEAAEAPLADRTGYAPPRRVWLERGARDAGERHEIVRELTRIGSAADNDIRIDGATAARYHAAITRTAERDHYAVALSGDARDLRVNGKPAARVRLRDGDAIIIAGETMTFRAARL